MLLLLCYGITYVVKILLEDIKIILKADLVANLIFFGKNLDSHFLNYT